MTRFACLASANSLLNWFFVLFLVERMHAHYFISILIVTLTLSAVTFATEEVWVFARTKVKKIQPQLAEK
jgi:putative flippase GtrA